MTNAWAHKPVRHRCAGGTTSDHPVFEFLFVTFHLPCRSLLAAALPPSSSSSQLCAAPSPEPPQFFSAHSLERIRSRMKRRSRIGISVIERTIRILASVGRLNKRPSAVESLLEQRQHVRAKRSVHPLNQPMNKVNFVFASKGVRDRDTTPEKSQGLKGRLGLGLLDFLGRRFGTTVSASCLRGHCIQLAPNMSANQSVSHQESRGP